MTDYDFNDNSNQSINAPESESRKTKKRIIRFRMFFGVENQDKFLNRMGKQNLLLSKAYPFIYIFKPTDTVWSYSVEWLNSAPESRENQEYISQKCESENLTYCGSKYCFAVFASPGEATPEKSRKTMEKIKSRYFTLSLFWSILSVYLTGLTVYHITWANKFNLSGYKVPDDKGEIMPQFDFVVGKNPAVLLLYLLIPLTALILAVTVMYWTEYSYWHKKCPKKKGPPALDYIGGVK